MSRRSNRWHDVICAQFLRALGGPLSIDQVLQGLVAAGFRHRSKNPRQTLGARIAELVGQKALERVGPATYKLTLKIRAAPVYATSQEVRIYTAADEKLEAL